MSPRRTTPLAWGAVAVLPATLAHPALADDIRFVDLRTNGLRYNAGDGMLYATVPSSAGAPRGNSITPIDPITGAIGASVFMGSEPLQLAISDSGDTIFVALDGAAMVRPFDAITQMPGAAFELGSGGLSLNYVEDMEVQPGSESVIAISLRNKGFSPRHEGVAIFDDGAKRLMMTGDHTGSNVIAWSDDPGTLYGYNNETTEFGLREMQVDLSGWPSRGSSAGSSTASTPTSNTPTASSTRPMGGRSTPRLSASPARSRPAGSSSRIRPANWSSSSKPAAATRCGRSTSRRSSRWTRSGSRGPPERPPTSSAGAPTASPIAPPTTRWCSSTPA